MDRSSYESLSPREREVLRLIPLLRTNQRIAARLGISTNTVKTQILSARNKLGGLDRELAADRLIEHEGGWDHPLGVRPERVMAPEADGAAEPGPGPAPDVAVIRPNTADGAGEVPTQDRNRLGVGTRLLLVPGVFLALCVAAAGLAVTFAQLQSWVHQWASALAERAR